MISLLKSEPNSGGEGEAKRKTHAFLLSSKDKLKRQNKKPTTELSGKCEDPKQLCLQRREHSDCSESLMLLVSGGGWHAPGRWTVGTAVFQRKGPKSLQYSNSLNETSIFRFLQLVSAMSSVSITCILTAGCTQDFGSSASVSALLPPRPCHCGDPPPKLF